MSLQKRISNQNSDTLLALIVGCVPDAANAAVFDSLDLRASRFKALVSTANGEIIECGAAFQNAAFIARSD